MTEVIVKELTAKKPRGRPPKNKEAITEPIEKKPRGRPPKEKEVISECITFIKKEPKKVHKYATEEEKIEGRRKAQAKYNEKKLYSQKCICECGTEYIHGNRLRHLNSVRHIGLLKLSQDKLIENLSQLEKEI